MNPDLRSLVSRGVRFQFIQEATGEVELSENIFNDSNSLFTMRRKKDQLLIYLKIVQRDNQTTPATWLHFIARKMTKLTAVSHWEVSSELGLNARISTQVNS